MPQTLPRNLVSVTVDLRFDQPGDLTRSGQPINSLAAVAPMMQDIKSAGFGAVILQTNTPIDTATGMVDTFAEMDPSSNKDKSLPRDFWAIAQHAKTLGLRVLIEPEIVNQLTDEHITASTRFGPEWRWQTFFDSVADYHRNLAATAQSYGIDGFYIGVMQHGLVGEQYRWGWQHIVDQVRTVFSGSLLHTANYNSNSVVWDMVDYVSLYTNPVLSRHASSDLEAIYREYFVSDTDTVTAVVDAYRQNYLKYGKPIIMDALSFNAGDTVVGDIDNIPGLVYQGKDLSQFSPNYAMQAARYQAAFELAGGPLNNIVYGVGIDGYVPWQQAGWIKYPNMNHPSSIWNKSATLGFDLAYAPSTVTQISPWLRRGIDQTVLKYGDDRDNVIAGQNHGETIRAYAGDDVIYPKGGNDVIWLGAGRDTVVFDTALNSRQAANIDVIKDFDAAQDRIVLDRKIFTAILGSDLTAAHWKDARGATDRDDRIIWNARTGDLWYDSNGNRSGGQVKICHIDLVGTQPLTVDNFDLI